MTLFQSLAFAAGYDPVVGPGSDCSATGSSGQCVVPWAGGTKSVSSVVLIATGVSFVVWSSTPIVSPNSLTLRSFHTGHDLDFYDNQFHCRLRNGREVGVSSLHRDLLGCTICDYQLDRWGLLADAFRSIL